MMNTHQKQARLLFETFQETICRTLEGYEPSVRFGSDRWTRAEGGGGNTRALEGGDVIEKAGVNTSTVHGPVPETMREAMPGNGDTFWASGLSLIIHPRNPFAPTTHANIRMIARGDTFWFGGGADLTPFYPFEEDNVHFHTVLKEACDRTDASFYPAYKERCDSYFYLPHREEHRGIGGIFYDYLMPTETHPVESLLQFTHDVGQSLIDAYFPILTRRHETPYEDTHRAFQSMRRGRYVEFNLLQDRGTKFGLQTKGRTESILISLPPNVTWVYGYVPPEGSPEEEIFDIVRNPRAWI